MVIMAHPDDAEICCFGTICSLTDSRRVIIVVATEGEAGISVKDQLNTVTDSSEFAKKRMSETTAAFSKLNVEFSYLGEKDGELRFARSLIVKVEKEILIHQPSIVITHFVDLSGLDHQDHAALGQAVVSACRRQSCVTTLLHAQPHNLGIPFPANYFVDISKYGKEKQLALARHRTQAGRYYLDETYHHARGIAAAIGIGTGFYNSRRTFESFFVSKTVIIDFPKASTFT